MLLDNCYISYLNMDHRLDRLMLLATQLERLGIKAERTRGKRPEEFDLTDQKYRRMLLRTKGAIGCFEGQLQIMRRALELGKSAVIFEDDIIFCDDFIERMNYFEKFLSNQDWAVAWLGATFHVNPPWWYNGVNPDIPQLDWVKRDAECTEDPRILKTNAAFCTYAYVVNINHLETIIEELEAEMGASIGIDYSFIKMQPYMNSYAMVPGSIIQRDNKSDIGLGDTIFSGFAKLGPYWWNKESMYNFDPTNYNWQEAANK